MIPENYPCINKAAFIIMGQLENQKDKFCFRFEVNRVTTSREELSTKERELQDMRERHIRDFPKIF